MNFDYSGRLYRPRGTLHAFMNEFRQMIRSGWRDFYGARQSYGRLPEPRIWAGRGDRSRSFIRSPGIGAAHTTFEGIAPSHGQRDRHYEDLEEQALYHRSKRTQIEDENQAQYLEQTAANQLAGMREPNPQMLENAVDSNRAERQSQIEEEALQIERAVREHVADPSGDTLPGFFETSHEIRLMEQEIAMQDQSHYFASDQAGLNNAEAIAEANTAPMGNADSMESAPHPAGGLEAIVEEEPYSGQMNEQMAEPFDPGMQGLDVPFQM